MPQPSVTKICLKITCLKLHSNFQGVNELIYVSKISPRLQYTLLIHGIYRMIFLIYSIYRMIFLIYGIYRIFLIYGIYRMTLLIYGIYRMTFNSAWQPQSYCKWDLKLPQYIPYLTLMGELWCSLNLEKWPSDIGRYWECTVAATYQWPTLCVVSVKQGHVSSVDIMYMVQGTLP